MKEETTQIFTPENIRGFIGRKVIVTDVTGLECHKIMEVSDSGKAARLSLLHPAAERTSWWELARLNAKSFDFAPYDKPAKVYASPIDELMDGFFAEMERLKVNTVLNQDEGARGPIDISFNFSVDGKEYTGETIHEIFAKRFGVPFHLRDTGADNCEDDGPTVSDHKWVTDMETGQTKYQFKMEWKTAEDIEQEPPKSDAKKSNWEPSR
jgi:hypothetical protein